jgi:acyl carrier protein
MRMSDVESRLADVFRTIFADESIELRDDMTADDIPAWDSVTHIQLIFAVEEEFGIKLGMKDLESLENVGDLMATIHRHLGRKATA